LADGGGGRRKCPAARKKEGGIIWRGKMPGERVRGTLSGGKECPDPAKEQSETTTGHDKQQAFSST